MKEGAGKVGKTIKVCVLYETNMKIPCTVEDIRSSYGRVELKVSPKHGTGSAWIREERICK